MLEEALERSDRILFDTCVLIDGFKAERAAMPYRWPREVPRRSRRTLTVSLVEFLRGPQDLSENERAVREQWLEEHDITSMDFDRDAGATLRSQLRASRIPRRLGSRTA